MKHYGWLAGGMIALFLLLFGVVELLEIDLLRDPSARLEHGGIGAAAFGVALLIADVLVPVPAALVMIANGALFGVALGTALSMLGSLGATAFGFWLGRRGGPWLDRLMSAEERRRGDALLDRFGVLAVVVTRPVPVLAETVAILAGTSPMRWGRLMLAAGAGSLPAALLLALTGATGLPLDDSLLVFGLVLIIAGILWLVGRGRRHGATELPEDAPVSG